MNIGIVTGYVVATIKHEVYNGQRLLLIQPCDAGKNLKPQARGESIVGIDTVQAGAGDTVLYVDEGNSARTVLKDDSAPVRVVIVGIVDSIET